MKWLICGTEFQVDESETECAELIHEFEVSRFVSIIGISKSNGIQYAIKLKGESEIKLIGHIISIIISSIHFLETRLRFEQSPPSVNFNDEVEKNLQNMVGPPAMVLGIKHNLHYLFDFSNFLSKKAQIK